MMSQRGKWKGGANESNGAEKWKEARGTLWQFRGRSRRKESEGRSSRRYWSLIPVLSLSCLESKLPSSVQPNPASSRKTTELGSQLAVPSSAPWYLHFFSSPLWSLPLSASFVLIPVASLCAIQERVAFLLHIAVASNFAAPEPRQPPIMLIKESYADVKTSANGKESTMS